MSVHNVCLFARTSQKPHVQNSSNFICLVHVAVALFFSDIDCIRYVYRGWCRENAYALPKQFAQMCLDTWVKIYGKQRLKILAILHFGLY